MFISHERRAIIRHHVWGAPDLVVEVLSARSAAHDRDEKLGWYRQYGVRECWLIDLVHEEIVVADFSEPGTIRRIAQGTSTIRSTVLPALEVAAAAIFIS
jgi:Uma2 family endonuclease